MLDRQPPYSLEAETAVIGSMLISGDAIGTAAEILDEDSFYRDKHRYLFSAMCYLYGEGKAVDVVTIADELKKRGRMESAGGFDYLASLIDVVPTAANVEHHAQIVADKATLRGLIMAAEMSIRDALDTGDMTVREVLDAAESRVLAVSRHLGENTSAWTKDMVIESMAELEDMLSGKSTLGIETGYPDVDRMTGGLKKGELTIVAGRPSMGKTAWVMNVAANVGITQQETVAIFSLEMSRVSLMRRLILSEARVSANAYTEGRVTREEHQRMAAAAEHVSMAPIWIDDQAAATILEVRAKARRVMAERGLGLVVVDYLQLMSAGTRAKDGNREQEVGQISRGLKALARELDVPVVAVSQLSRAPEKRESKRPLLSDLRESGSLEQDADLIMFLFRPEYYAPPSKKDSLKGAADLTIGKQRNGPTGVVDLYFNAEYTRFDSLDKGP